MRDFVKLMMVCIAILLITFTITERKTYAVVKDITYIKPSALINPEE